MLDRLRTRYGHRGVWLIVLGVMWVGFGFSVWLDPNAPRPWVLIELLPNWAYALGWWVSGAVAIGTGLRGPARDDTVGHVALYLMPALRVVSFTVAWAIYLISELLVDLGCVDTVTGYSRGWYAALIWSLASFMLALVAAWPNPAAPTFPTVEDLAVGDG